MGSLRVVVAMDSLKGCLGSAEAGMAVRSGILRACPDAEVTVLEIADGGEGTGAAIRAHLGGEVIRVECHDALGRPSTGKIVILPDGLTAVVELAEAAGLASLSDEERDVMLTSTYGFGEMIAAAITAGARKVICTLGGSATNDAGLGALQALGLRIRDTTGREITHPVTGGDLSVIGSLDVSAMKERLSGISLEFLYDADIDFTGPRGAVAMYSSQKGAGPEDRMELERGMENVARLMCESAGRDVSSIRGAGAAGGTGGAFGLLAGAVARCGIDVVLDAVRFDEVVAGADLAVTGEGRADAQTRQGKAAQGVLGRARRHGVPVALLAGCIVDRVALAADGYSALIDINEGFSATDGDPCNPEIARTRLAAAAGELIAAEGR